jgi:hypothetical protein
MLSLVVCSRNSSRLITLEAMGRGDRRGRRNWPEGGEQRRSWEEVKPVLYELTDLILPGLLRGMIPTY